MRFALLIIFAACLRFSFANASTANAQAEDRERADIALINASIKEGRDLNASDPSGTVLWKAVNWNRRDVVKALLDAGADPNLCVGECPVFVAAGKDTEILRLLVAHGADVNRATAKYGYTPLIRVSDNRAEIFETLRREGKYRGPAPNTLESARILIAAGADVNHVDAQNQTPLRMAMAANNLELAEALLKAGANVRWRASYSGSTTVLMETISMYSPPEDPVAVRLLLDHGADPNDRNDEMYVPLCEEGKSGCGWRGSTALTYAARWGMYRVVELLLRRGADPSLPRTDGRTALELARANKHPKTAALIAQYIAQQDKSSVGPQTNQR